MEGDEGDGEGGGREGVREGMEVRRESGGRRRRKGESNSLNPLSN